MIENSAYLGIDLEKANPPRYPFIPSKFMEIIQQLKILGNAYKEYMMPAKCGILIICAENKADLSNEIEILSSKDLLCLMKCVKELQRILKPNSEYLPRKVKKDNIDYLMSYYKIQPVNVNTMQNVNGDYFVMHKDCLYRTEINQYCINQLRNIRPNLKNLTTIIARKEFERLESQDNTALDKNRVEEKVFLATTCVPIPISVNTDEGTNYYVPLNLLYEFFMRKIVKSFGILLHGIFSQDIHVELSHESIVTIKSKVPMPLAIIAEFNRLNCYKDVKHVFTEILTQYQIIEMYYDFLISIGDGMKFIDDSDFQSVRLGLYNRIQILSLYSFKKLVNLDPMIIKYLSRFIKENIYDILNVQLFYNKADPLLALSCLMNNECTSYQIIKSLQFYNKGIYEDTFKNIDQNQRKILDIIEKFDKNMYLDSIISLKEYIIKNAENMSLPFIIIFAEKAVASLLTIRADIDKETITYLIPTELIKHIDEIVFNNNNNEGAKSKGGATRYKYFEIMLDIFNVLWNETIKYIDKDKYLNTIDHVRAQAFSIELLEHAFTVWISIFINAPLHHENEKSSIELLKTIRKIEHYCFYKSFKFCKFVNNWEGRVDYMKGYKYEIRNNKVYNNPFKNYYKYVKEIYPAYSHQQQKEIIQNKKSIIEERNKASAVINNYSHVLFNLHQDNFESIQIIRAMQYSPLHILEYCHISSLRELNDIISMIKETKRNPKNLLVFDKLKQMFWEKEKAKQEKEGGVVQMERANWGRSVTKKKKKDAYEEDDYDY